MGQDAIQYSIPERLRKSLEDPNNPYVFSRNAQKSEIFNQPLLVIGLGGSGYDALSRAKEKMVDCFRTDSKGNLDGGVAFLEIDTDDRDMKKCLENPRKGSLNRKEFKIFQNADIGAILRHKDTDTDVLPEEIKKWLDPNIPVAQIVHGAAGIRQAGRLLLHLNSVEVIDCIKEKLNEIRQSVVLSKNPVNVVIFTGLGGGTGSGIFVDVAYIVRECIKEFSGQAFITGIVLMPDILAGDPNVDKITRENIKRNGFAALKELDHLMNLSETQDSFSQEFPGGFRVEDTQEAIFDRCVLVSSMAEGRLLLPNAKEHAYNISAEMLIDMMSNSSTVSNGSNDVSRRDAALTGNKNRKPANYVYTAVGGRAVYVDFDFIFNLFAKYVLACDMDPERALSDEEIEASIKNIWEQDIKKKIEDFYKEWEEIPVDNWSLVIMNRSNGQPYTEDENINKTSIRKNPKGTYIPAIKREQEKLLQKDLAKLDEDADSLMTCFSYAYNKIDRSHKRKITALRNKIVAELNEKKKDVDLNNTNGDTNASSELEDYKNSIESYCAYYSDKKNAKKKKKEERSIAQKVKDFLKPPEIEEPKEKFKEISTHRATELKVAKWDSLIDNLIQRVRAEFVSKYEDNQKISEEMRQFYEAARIQWSGIMERKYNPNPNSCTEEIPAGKIFPKKAIENYWVRSGSLFGEMSIVPPKKDLKVNFRDLTAAAYAKTFSDLIENECITQVDDAAWEYKRQLTDETLTQVHLGANGVSPAVTTGQIFEKAFDNAPIDMDTVLEKMLKLHVAELEEVWADVIRAILSHSGVLYSRKAMKDGEVFERPGYTELMIPRGSKRLAAVCKELTGQKAEESDIKHRISYMKYEQCQKIDDYIYIDELERVYNQSNSKFGLHLYDNKEEMDVPRWAELSSPVYRNAKADIQMSERYADAKNAVLYRTVFEAARKFGWIEFDTAGKKYYINKRNLKKELTDDYYIDETSNNGMIYLCTVECSESKATESYTEYCKDWFVKMFYYRNLIERALKYRYIYYKAESIIKGEDVDIELLQKKLEGTKLESKELNDLIEHIKNENGGKQKIKKDVFWKNSTYVGVVGMAMGIKIDDKMTKKEVEELV